MTEEQRQYEQRRYRKTQGQRALAQRHPSRERPQREPDAEQIIHRADEEDVVVEQRERDQRQHGPMAIELTMERERAGKYQHEAHDGVDLSGEIDVHDPL